MQNSFKLNATSVQQILANRAIIRLTDAGKTLRFHVQGNGNTIAVTTKDGAPVLSNGTDIPLMKTIYGLKCNSHVALLNPRNQQIFRDAIAAEQAGAEADEVHAALNDYLNKVQVSFSVIINPGRTPQQFFNGQLVEGEVVLITTEKGQLLTIDNVRPVAVEKAAATPAFTINDLMGIDEPTPETVFTPVEGATAGVTALEGSGETAKAGQ